MVWQDPLELIGESHLMGFISFIIGGALALLLEDKMAVLFKGKIDILKDSTFSTVSVSLLFIVLTGIISGIMPTIAVKYKPIDVVKGSFRYHSKMVLSRIFIILQNVITMTMMTATLDDPAPDEPSGKCSAGLQHGKHLNRVSSDNPEVEKCPGKASRSIQGIGSFSGTSLDGNYRSMSTRKDKDNNNLLVYLTTWDKEFIDIMGHQSGQGQPSFRRCEIYQ